MKTKSQIISAIGEQGVLPLFYHEDLYVCRGIVNALYHAGIRVIEFTNRGPAALDNFSALIQQRDSIWPGLLFGAGTIKSVVDARAFLLVGADFLISPALITGIAEIAKLENFTWIPGCTTPTEIATAEQYGFNVIKLFPGNLLGPSFLSAIRDIFPDILFMPTGGVTQSVENLQQWFLSGVFAVGLGSQLISKTLLDEKNYARIGEDTANLLAIVKAIRNLSH